MSVVREICSHVAIMKSGEVVEDGKVSEIFTHPKSDVARDLLAEIGKWYWKYRKGGQQKSAKGRM